MKVIREILEEPQHVLICGATRSGKTTLSKLFVGEALRRGIKVIVIDFDGEYNELPRLKIALPRECTPHALARVVALEGRSGGHATYMAISKAITKSSDTVDELLTELEKIAQVDYALRVGAMAAWSRLDPFRGIPLVSSYSLNWRTGRFDLSPFLFTHTKAVVAAILTAALSALVAGGMIKDTLLVLEESHYYFQSSDAVTIERIGLRRGVKLIRIQQGLPKSFLNYVPILGYGGAEWWAQGSSNLRVPEEQKNLRRYEFLYFADGKWRKLKLK